MSGSLHIDFLQVSIIAIGYIITIGTSGWVVRHFIEVPKPSSKTSDPDESISGKRYDLGAIIGKCENFLAITFILADAITGLALIFAAKSIVRSEDIKKDPRYYLGGTLVNLCFSVLIAFLVRIILNAIGHPI
ncbi:hypothetical protein KA005_54775 [bacterium]|nr:hypothetical protein [bacterium]